MLGLHFFSPANIMKLLEVVVGRQTAADTVATGFELARRLRKIPVRAGVCDGFIGNRILAVHRQAADMMMEDGASPYEIDAAVRDFGYPMGPYQMVDLAGGDIGWATRKRRAATRDPALRYVQIPDRLCERGWFGQKTGRGFYLYPDGARHGTPDPEVLAIIDAERQRAGVTPRPFSAEDIQRRYLAAMINEAANVLHQGIALRPRTSTWFSCRAMAFRVIAAGRCITPTASGWPTCWPTSAPLPRKTPRSGSRRHCWWNWPNPAAISPA